MISLPYVKIDPVDIYTRFALIIYGLLIYLNLTYGSLSFGILVPRNSMFSQTSAQSRCVVSHLNEEGPENVELYMYSDLHL